MRIGIVGYSGQKFDTQKAEELVARGLGNLLKMNGGNEASIVSGLTDVGIRY